MNRLFHIFAAALLFFASPAFAQSEEEESNSPLEFSGSVDTYYKYDFSGTPNIGTSFASDQNSFSLGMFNLIATKEVGKASFVADIGMGPRNASSVGPSDYEFQPGIQNLYVSYAATENLTFTGGYMGTFVGYEIISPAGNFNYSTSYLFTNGPFQNAGFKVDYAINDKVAIMAGVFNDWNVYHQPAGIDLSSFGAQLAVSPVDGLDMYFNFVTGDNDGSELDLTAGYQISDQFYIGLNAASWKVDIPAINDEASFKGAALYAQYGVSDVVALGLRGEMFSTKNSGYIGYDLTSGAEAEGVTAITLSANIGSGALKLIPEFRFDSASEAVFTDANSNPTNLAVQGLVAAVFAF